MQLVFLQGLCPSPLLITTNTYTAGTTVPGHWIFSQPHGVVTADRVTQLHCVVGQSGT